MPNSLTPTPTSKRTLRSLRLSAALASIALSADAFAQAAESSNQSPPPAPPSAAPANSTPPPSDLPLFEGDETEFTDGGREFRFIFGGGYTHAFETSLDSGGDFSVDEFTAGLNIATNINRDLTLDFRLNVGVASYNFSGNSGLGGGFGGLDPWGDIFDIGLGMAASWSIDEHWTVFGGPVLQFAGESGADWGDSFNIGGIGGATYRFSDSFMLGGGLSVTSQIEDDVRVFPIIIIQWNFAENWRIANAGPSGGRSSIELTGLELIWSPAKKWDLALGVGSSYSRFRLEDDNVGQTESTPFWFRAGWRPTPTVSLEGIAGLSFGGELSLDDSNGNGIAHSDFDAPLFVGLFGSVRF